MRFSIKTQNFDPGYYALKRSIKTFVAMWVNKKFRFSDNNKQIRKFGMDKNK